MSRLYGVDEDIDFPNHDNQIENKLVGDVLYYPFDNDFERRYGTGNPIMATREVTFHGGISEEQYAQSLLLEILKATGQRLPARISLTCLETCRLRSIP
ncbi:MAG TPA: hypothetical protein VGK87_12155 [Anaerolineae bacterium]|jgi:hypothetical protein